MQWQDTGTDDDLDPLAPPSYASPEADVDDETGQDGGFSDPERIVRIWLTDGRLSRVRVSPVWYQRLDERPLEPCFEAAFRLANVGVAAIPEVPDDDAMTDVDLAGLPLLDDRTLTRLRELFAEVTARLRSADPRPRPAGTARAPTQGRSKGVTVWLDAAGRAHRVQFDPAWLDEAQAGNIATHVRLAAADAYRRFVPAPPSRSEFDDVRDEHRLLMAATRAMLTPRSAR